MFHVLGRQSEEERKRQLAVFAPAFEQLVALLRGRVRYPVDWDSREQNDRDDFTLARQDVGDALLDAAGAHLAKMPPTGILCSHPVSKWWSHGLLLSPRHALSGSPMDPQPIPTGSSTYTVLKGCMKGWMDAAQPARASRCNRTAVASPGVPSRSVLRPRLDRLW